MILCSCNVLSDQAVAEALLRDAVSCPRALLRQLCGGARCGRCLRSIQAVIAAHRPVVAAETPGTRI